MSANVRVVIPSINARIREVLTGCGYLPKVRDLPANGEVAGFLGMGKGIAFHGRPENPHILVRDGEFDASINDLTEGLGEVGCDFASGTSLEPYSLEEIGAKMSYTPRLREDKRRLATVIKLGEAIKRYLKDERVVTLRYTLPHGHRRLQLPHNRVVKQSARGGILRVPFTELGRLSVDLANSGAHWTIQVNAKMVGEFRFS